MKNLLKISVLFIVFFSGFTSASAETLVLVGKIPGEYLRGVDKNTFSLGYVQIKDDVIVKVSSINNAEKINSTVSSLSADKVIILKNKKTGQFDAIYPGLIDLHNHAKANVLPVWKDAQGQFSNRFEWRGESSYKHSVSSNMNLWVNTNSMITCASYRWNELQAMTLGTTYLQGNRACDANFSILKVENPDNFKNSDKLEVKAPTDLVMPDDMVFVWNTLKPIMDKNQYNYEQAMAQVLRTYCPAMTEVTDEHVSSPGKAYKLINGYEIVDPSELETDAEGNKISDGDGTLLSKTKLKNKAWVTEKCMPKDEMPAKFIRYMYFVHKSVASKKKYLDDDKHSAYIVHLGEGRRDDPYNQIEFKIVQLIGLNRKNVSFVHGLGLSQDEMKFMANTGMGLIWSPYSNLLLYGQTLDFAQLQKAEGQAGKKIALALGSDWTPTGSKSVLEELKLAREYMLKTGKHDVYNDEALYNMVTTGPAKIINHSDEIGTLKKNAMGSVIVASILDENPYTNLVAKVWARDINLVVVNGQAIYGNESYIKSVHKSGTEDITTYVGEMSDWVDNNGKVKYSRLAVDAKVGMQTSIEDGGHQHLVVPPLKFERAEDKVTYLHNLSRWIVGNDDKFAGSMDACSFDEKKLFIHQDSGDEKVQDLKLQTGLNLDRMYDIQKLVSVGLMTQSRNIHDSSKGKLEYRAQYFPHLFTCADEYQKNRLMNFVQSDSDDDEFSRNLGNASDEQEKCSKFGVCREPKKN